MKKNVYVVAFIKELYKRFALPSPRFFQVVQAIGMVAAFIGFIPDILMYLEITPNPIFSRYLALALKVSGIVVKLLAKLPVENAGKVAATTNKMPFTSSVKS
jgi:hypothetical protein